MESKEHPASSVAKTVSSSSDLDVQQEPRRPDDAMAASKDLEYVKSSRLVIIVIAVALACFLMLIDTSIVSTVIPRITDEFDSLPDVGWYASAYQFGSAAPQLLTGKVYLHFQTKASFLFFFGIFELGSILCGAAVSSTMFIVGRAVAGLGAAGIINGAIMIISGCAPLEKRPGLIGLTVGVGQLGLAVGPLIGGALASYSTWRWCFYLNAPVGAVTGLAIAFCHIPEQTAKEKPGTIFRRLYHYLDLAGFLLFAPAVLQLLLALQFGVNRFPWDSSQVIGLFCGAGATFVVWLVWNQYRGNDALLPTSMVSQRTVWVGGLFQALFMSALYGSIYFLPIYFQSINNASALLSGVYLLPTILPELFMAAAAGGLLMKIGYVIPLTIVSVIFLATSSGLYSLLGPHSPTGWWVGFQILNGVGAGLGLNMALNAIQATVSGEQLSSAMSFLVFAQSLGPAVSLILCNVIFIDSLRSQLPIYAPNVNAASVVGAGATGFRMLVHPSDLPGVLQAYANSLDRTFYLIAALAALCGLVLWGLGWKDLRAKHQVESEDGLCEEK